MRIRTAFGGAAAAAAAVVAVVGTAGCGSSATVDPVAQAADVTQQQPGEQLRFTEQVSSPGLPAPITFTGSGYINQHQKAGVLSFDLSKIPGASSLPGSKTMEIRFAFPVLYLKAGFFASRLPGQKPWLKIDLQQAGKAAGINFSQLTQTGAADPTQYLNFLKASGSVTKVGSESVNGIATTHYKAVMDLNRVIDRVPASERAAAHAGVSELEKISGTSSMPVDVWIDNSHRVRREQFAFHTSVPGRGSVAATMTADFVSFGPTPPVTTPPSDQVFDVTGFAAQGLKKATGG